MEAAASVVGIVSFGLGLAKSLQTFVETVIEAEETIVLIVAEVNATASTLQRLQDFIEQDKAASKEQHRATVFNDTGLKEIGACASQCQKIYVQIIVLIEKASIQNGEDGSKTKGPQVSAADNTDAPAVRLAVFSKNVTMLGRKMRWPWLEPRIKRCQEHLARLKVSLMLSLQVFLIAESRSRPFVALVSKTNDEDELRDRAEALRKKMKELRAKQDQQHPPKARPPGFGDGIREASAASSLTSEPPAIVSGDSGDTSSSIESIVDPADSASYSALPPTRPRRRHRSRGYRAVRALRTFKAYFLKKAERRSVFKKDSTSTIFEAYLIHPFTRELLGPSTAETTPSTPHTKLPFGHRRLNREMKRALRKFNPWDILLRLDPANRNMVNDVVQQIQAASSNMSVCLVAIDIDNYSGSNYDLDLEPITLSWRRMVLFFRLEPVYSEEDAAESWGQMISGPSRFTSILGNAFQSSLHTNTKRKKMQAMIKRRKGEKEREEAKTKANKEIIERDKAQMEEDMKALEVEKIRLRDEKEDLEAQKTRIAEEKELVESGNRALRNAEKAVLENIRRGTAEEELEKIFEEERARKTFEEERARKMFEEELAIKMKKEELSKSRLEAEHAKKAAFERAAAEKEAMEKELAAAEKAKPPVKFKDAVGRKFTFPFHLARTWQGMEDLVKQAFIHVETIGSQVQEGHYDLIDSEEQVILPSAWAETIKPGSSITMRLWPMEREPLLPEDSSSTNSFLSRRERRSRSYGSRNAQHLHPPQEVHFEIEQRAAAAAAAKARLSQDQDRLRIPPGAWAPSGGSVPPTMPPYGVTAGLPVGGAPPPPLKARYETVEPYVRHKKAQGIASFFGQNRRAKKSSGPKKSAQPPTGKRSKRGGDEDVEDLYKDELAEDIDKELGLDDLEVPEQMASKGLDELLAAWTNPVRE